ncbi:hypothetical protein [Amycolatopsis sp. DG1A-15b]|uniref:hypothetical protein n=1 Tax=Amycolatopsis sp. DG1A-15b TaxID=3052846 RepID=UPI00255BDA3F|nr:hypothetical protein [Amycolatopsis sp. DG1A-15b]WIX84797.1 hypothetical protein QRY02_26495 [Amycolatopsis sp. DG1A-15b]
MPGVPAPRRGSGPRAEVPGRGPAAGERALYAAPGDEAALTGQLRGDERCDEGLDRWAVQVASVDVTSLMRTPARLVELLDLTGVRVGRAA